MTSPPKRRSAARGSGVPSSTGSGKRAGQVRIIAGRWRGRKLPVASAEGLRPTGDRIRETLFNWLQADVAGACCLDLFAGSGALGFEALSRYAHHVVFVETDAGACRALKQSCQQLEVVESEPFTRSDIHSAHGESLIGHPPIAHLIAGTAQHAIEQWVQLGSAPAFDLVFIDPPFQSACQWMVLESLVPTLLADGALVYLEAPTAQAAPDLLPRGCELVREKRFGDVAARLIRFAREV